MPRYMLLLLLLVGLCLAPGVSQGAGKSGLMQEDAGIVNALRYAATPTTRTSATLTAALSAIGSLPRTLWLPVGTWTVSANVTIPATTTLWISQGTSITVNTGITLTVNGPIRIDGTNAFAGAGTVVLPMAPLLDVRWFGAACDNATDDTAALQRAVAALNATTGGRLDIPEGICLFNSPLVLTKSGVVQGRGPGRSLLASTNATMDMLRVIGTNVVMEIKDLQLTTAVTKTGGAAIYAGTVNPTDGFQSFLVVRNVMFVAQYNGIDLANSAYATLVDNKMQSIRNWGIHAKISSNPDAGDTLIHGNVLSGLQTAPAGIYTETSGYRISQNKVLGFDISLRIESNSPNPPYGCCSDVIINGNSVEAYATRGLLIQTPTALAALGNVHVTSNQFGVPSVTATAHLAVSGRITNLLIAQNIIQVPYAGNGGIGIASGATGDIPSLYSIHGNILQGFGAATVGIQVPNAVGTGGNLVSHNVISNIPSPYSGTGAIFRGDTIVGAQLGAFGGAGSQIYCSDCTVVSGSDNTCTSPGSGAMATKVGTTWRCFALQN